MASKRTKKDPLAVRLGRRGGLASRKKLSAAQRKESARAAIMARWHPKEKPKRWYLLLGMTNDLDHPEVLVWSQDKNELLEQAKKVKDRNTMIVEVPYNPSKFTITKEFSNDQEAQVKALQTVLKGGQS